MSINGVLQIGHGLRKTVLCCLALIFLFTTSQSQEVLDTKSSSGLIYGVSTNRLERYDEFLEKEIAKGNIPGAVSLVMRKGGIVHSKAFGYKDVIKETSMGTDDVFFIQSMTKPIISVAIMQLFEEGHFLLNDPVSKYLDDFKSIRVVKNVADGINGETQPTNAEITILHLLTHTAGFSHGLGSSYFDQQVREQLFNQEYANISERVTKFLKTPLIYQPGDQWYYSAATDVLSILIEKFSGMTTEEFINERIFTPLGMEHTGYNVKATDTDKIVQVHGFNENGKLTKLEYQPNATENKVFSGVNGLFSTPGDYLKFCQMLLNQGEYKGEKLLSRKTVDLMTRNHLHNLFVTPGVGFGLGFGVVTDITKTGNIGSDGTYYWGGAFCTYFFIDPKEELVGILMTQLWPYSDYYGDKMRQFIYQSIID